METFYETIKFEVPKVMVRFWRVKFDKLVKSQRIPVFVIPANAGIQETQPLMDSRFRGNDGLGNFLRDHQNKKKPF